MAAQHMHLQNANRVARVGAERLAGSVLANFVTAHGVASGEEAGEEEHVW